MARPMDRVEQGQFDEVLWEIARHPEAGVGRTAETSLAGCIAAQQLGLWREARRFALEWARQGAHAGEGPLVSIVVPTCDRPEFLRRAVKSVASQLYRPLELIVVDDSGGGGSDLEELVRRHAGDVAVKVVHHDRNRYLAAARNTGLEHVTGRWVGFLDDDDQFYPHHVGHLVALLTRSPARAAAALPYMQRTRDGALRLDPYPMRAFQWYELLVDNVIPVQGVLFDADLISEIGPFDTSLRANEDWEYWIRLRERTAVEQSPVRTSLVDCTREDERMSASLAPFVDAHARIYDRYRERTELAGGAELAARQARQLDELTTLAVGQLEPTVAPACCIVDGDGDTLPDVGAGPAAVFDTDDAAGAAAWIRERIDAGERHVAWIEEPYVGSLPPRWGARLALHLAADPTLDAVAARDLSMDESDDDPATIDAERASAFAGRRSEGDAAHGSLMLWRAESLARRLDDVVGLDDHDDTDDLLERLCEGASVAIAEDTPLLPERRGEAASTSRVARRDEPRPDPLVVVCYHRVVDDGTPDPLGLAVGRRTFAAHLAAYAEHFRVIGADEIDEIDGIDAPPHPTDTRPRLLITFDDGYRDNYEAAFPLLDRAGLPWVLFAATDAIDSGAPFWWERWAASERFSALTADERERWQRELRFMPPAERDARLEREFGAVDASRCPPIATWAMLDEMHRDGRLTVGAHTRRHPSLGELPEEAAREEIVGSIDAIEARLGVRPTLFAYPHGAPEDLGPHASAILREAGIARAFTTTPAAIDALPALDDDASRRLPRVLVGEMPAPALVAHLLRLVDRRGATQDTDGTGRRSIAVLSGITANNLGDDAMLVATVRDLQRLDPDAELCVLAEDPARCAEVRVQIPDVPILPSLQGFVQAFLAGLDGSEHPTLAVADLARALLLKQEAILAGEPIDGLTDAQAEGLRRLMSADGVVDCGGANLTCHWKSFFYEKCIDYLVAAKPLLVSGQGIDRFDDEHDRGLLRAALSQATEVTLREPLSTRYLEELGVEATLSTTGDDALTLDAAPAARVLMLLEPFGLLDERRHVVPYLAFQYRHYLDYEDDESLDRFAAYVDAAISATGLPVVGVPMHFGNTDERNHLRAVAGRVAARDRFHVIERHLSPGDAKALMGAARAAFGISYHSAVFALSAATPYVGLYRGDHYTQKMQGLAELFGDPDLPVPVDTTDPAAFAKRLLARHDRRAEIGAHLRARTAALVERVLDSRRRFLDRVVPSHKSWSDSRPVSPGASAIRWGALRTTEPISRDWGFDRGTPVDRFYIDRFLEAHAGRIRGAVCELLDDGYTRRFGGDGVERIEILDIDPDNPRATLVDDLTAPRHLDGAGFDCFILTQTLPYIYECGAALGNAYRSLKDGGSLLVTVPSIIKYHREPEDHWRFTPDSLSRLIRDHCPGAEFRVEAHGNLLAAVGFLHGVASEELDERELLLDDPQYPLVVTACITRRAQADDRTEAA